MIQANLGNEDDDCYGSDERILLVSNHPDYIEENGSTKASDELDAC